MDAAAPYDVAIVGAGPAGLSAALVLGRCQRRVIIFDHGKPRNRAAQIVNCYLGVSEGSPHELRQIGRQQIAKVGVQYRDEEVVGARCQPTSGLFELSLAGGELVQSRKLLLATGMRDELPDIENLADFYGKSVHHCPFCDGYEHRQERLLALGTSSSVVDLALFLKEWTPTVTACCHGSDLSFEDKERLVRHGIECRSEKVRRLHGEAGLLERVEFDAGPELAVDAIFFSAGQGQRSSLPAQLACECDENGLVRTTQKQRTGIPGLFLAGDADGDVQFAIVAAAEGAIAATAIQKELHLEDIATT